MGRVASPYGVRGWTKVISFTDPIDNLLKYKQWELKYKNIWETITIEKGKIHGKWLIVKFAGTQDRDVAKKYTNCLIAIPREQLATLPTDEYYWSDLIGLSVITTQGTMIGHIDGVMATGANDVLVIKNAENKDVLIPYLKHVVQSIDLVQKRMIVDWEIE